MIPFIDLPSHHRTLEAELLEVFQSALRSAAFIGGRQVQAFEEEFARFCGTRYCVGVNSGTDALRFILIAAGIGAGDEVITVPNTFIATAEAISQAGATPAFIDIDERTYNLDPEALSNYLKSRFSGSQNPRTSKSRPRAVIPVHLYGQPADMDAIADIAHQYDLMVIEDACQAHGAEYYSSKEGKWKKAGAMGIASAFSFYPGKNLGACGDGGAVTTNREDIAGRVQMLRDHGQAKKYYHEMEGYNGRLDAIQAGILRLKLKHLDQWNAFRRRHACYYNELLESAKGVHTPFEPDWARAVYHLYVIRVAERDLLQAHLLDHGVSTGLHYPIPLHLQPAYRKLGYQKGSFPRTERIASEILSLPMYPELTQTQQQRVVQEIRRFLGSSPMPVRGAATSPS